jgi:hypothetical protein
MKRLLLALLALGFANAAHADTPLFFRLTQPYLKKLPHVKQKEVVYAQSVPQPPWTQGYVPTPGQWNQAWASKQDVLGYGPLNSAGGSMTGRLVTWSGYVQNAGFNLAPGNVPSQPQNGDMWVTSAGLFVQVNGGTVGPIQPSPGTNVAASLPLTSSSGGSTTTINLNNGVSVLLPSSYTGPLAGLEMVQPVQVSTGASKTFTTSDLFKLTRRSNAGSAMTDTFPSTGVPGMVEGTRIVVDNVDGSASITINAGVGTLMPNGTTDVIAAGRQVSYTYNAALTQWRWVANSNSAALASATNTFTKSQLINLNTVAAPGLQTGDLFQITGPDTTQTGMEINTFGAIPVYNLIRYDGTNGSRTAVISGDMLGSYQFLAYDGSGIGTGGYIAARATQNWTGGAHGTKTCIGSTPTGSISAADSLCQQPSGGITIGSPSGGTGGDMGAGTINVATNIYKNGVATSGTVTSVGGNYPLTGTVTGAGNLGYAGPTTSGQLIYNSGNTLLFTPFNGDMIRINGTIYQIPTTSIACHDTATYLNGSPGGTLLSANYYWVFLFNNAGTLTCDFYDSAHLGPNHHQRDVTAGNVGTEVRQIAGPGVDSTRSLIGMVYYYTPQGGFASSASFRFVRSWYNDWGETCSDQEGSTFTVSSTSAVGMMTNFCQILCWNNESMFATGQATGFASAAVSTAGTGGGFILGFDSATSGSWSVTWSTAYASQPASNTPFFATYAVQGLSEQIHYVTLGGYVLNASSANYNFSGRSALATTQRH